MEYVNLGNTGLKVSRLCLGCMSYGDPGWRDWILPEEEARPFFEEEMLPFLESLGALMDDMTAYERPERLPNGDIIIRRKTPLEKELEDEINDWRTPRCGV